MRLLDAISLAAADYRRSDDAAHRDNCRFGRISFRAGPEPDGASGGKCSPSSRLMHDHTRGGWVAVISWAGSPGRSLLPGGHFRTIPALSCRYQARAPPGPAKSGFALIGLLRRCPSSRATLTCCYPTLRAPSRPRTGNRSSLCRPRVYHDRQSPTVRLGSPQDFSLTERRS